MIYNESWDLELDVTFADSDTTEVLLSTNAHLALPVLQTPDAHAKLFVELVRADDTVVFPRASKRIASMRSRGITRGVLEVIRSSIEEATHHPKIAPLTRSRLLAALWSARALDHTP